MIADGRILYDARREAPFSLVDDRRLRLRMGEVRDAIVNAPGQ
jgi:hypothetical protein